MTFSSTESCTVSVSLNEKNQRDMNLTRREIQGDRKTNCSALKSQRPVRVETRNYWRQQ